MTEIADRHAKALAGLRIAVGVLFLIFAQYKVFGTQFTLADQLFFDQVEEQALQKADLCEAARANTEEDFGLVWEQALDGLFIDRMEGNDEVFRKVMADELKRALVSSILRARVYARARREAP